MIRPNIAFAFLLALLLAIVLPFAEVAYGEEDAPKEDTPAAKAFRDAWWQETGAGALDKALEGYRAALAAEGSEEVRARSLYRMGLVLQRMGKMDEALNAMKRLATEFPGQAALLAKAKQRLDEWTAIDLREQFPEWYRRYQYSPEFQAKIVDLVLKLGAPKTEVQHEAKAELLTIGAPAIPALQQHAGSANSHIRRGAMEILLDLGQLPPAKPLFDGSRWREKKQFWRLLHAADDATKGAFRAAAEAKPKDWRAAWVLATLDGPDAILAILRGKQTDAGDAVDALLAPWLDNPPSDTFLTSVRALVVDDAVDAHLRASLASRLRPWHDFDGGEPHPFGLTPDEVVTWAGSEVQGVREAAWQAMRQASVHTDGALEAVTKEIQTAHARRLDTRKLSGALLGILRMRDSAEGLDEQVTALTKLLSYRGWSGLDRWALNDWGPQGKGSLDVPVAVMAQAIGQVQGRNTQGLPANYYGLRTNLSHEAKWAQLLAWTETAKDEQVRRDAMRQAAMSARGDLLALTEPLTRPDVSADFVRDFFQGLQSNQDLKSLPWDAESISRLIEAANKGAKRHKVGSHSRVSTYTIAGKRIGIRYPYGSTEVNVFMNLLHAGAHTPTVFRAAVMSPERFDNDVWWLLGEGWNEAEANRALVRQSLEAGWSRWTPEQRQAGLGAVLSDPTIKRGDKATDALLRSMLAAKGNNAAVRSWLLRYVSELSLEDVSGAFDLTRNEEVDAAANLVRRLPKTRAVYDAFVPALRPDGEMYDPLLVTYRHHKDPALVRDLITRLLAHNDAGANTRGTELLVKRGRAEDLPIWIGALQHREASVRKLAAERLGRLYNDDAIKALAKAVDDADPDVRDAALASLAKIEKTEKEKERWRRFAKEGADK